MKRSRKTNPQGGLGGLGRLGGQQADKQQQPEPVNPWDVPMLLPGDVPGERSHSSAIWQPDPEEKEWRRRRAAGEPTNPRDDWWYQGRFRGQSMPRDPRGENYRSERRQAEFDRKWKKTEARISLIWLALIAFLVALFIAGCIGAALTIH